MDYRTRYESLRNAVRDLAVIYKLSSPLKQLTNAINDMEEKPVPPSLINLPYNKLTFKEAELIDLLQEECGEVIGILAKIKRHGMDSFHPESREGNRDSLDWEIADVFAAMTLLSANNMLTIPNTEQVQAAIDRKKKWLHHFKDVI